MDLNEALGFIELHGIVLQAARGPVPNLAEALVGRPIQGGWWGHPMGKEIFRLSQAVGESPDILVCKLVEGKVTYIHRRLWPALVKLAARFRGDQLAKVSDVHMATGVHRSRRDPFPLWVPVEVVKQAKAMSETEAEAILLPWLGFGHGEMKAGD